MSCLIIAELSANHNNNLDTALHTAQAAIDSGADAIKVQTYRPESLALDIDNEIFGPKTEGPWKGWRPWDLYKEACLPYEWHYPIKELVEKQGKIFFSSPFDLEAVDFLEELEVPIYKIASFEINDIPLIRKAAATQKPIIISTGVASIEDIELAVKTCREIGNEDITLLKCTSEYPAQISDANLTKMLDFRDRFGVKIGLSDHTEGSIVALASAALGAKVIEKHFILDRKLGGVDSAFSMEPKEFNAMVHQVRAVESTLGSVDYEVKSSDKKRKRSLFATKDIKAGESFTSKNVRSLRPNVGLAPVHYDSLLTQVANRDILAGDPIQASDIK